MVRIEDVERESGLRSPKGGGVPTDPQKLTVVLDPLGSLCARAELYVETVDPVVAHDEEHLSFLRQGARSVFVADVETITQLRKGCAFEEFAIPELSAVRKR